MSEACYNGRVKTFTKGACTAIGVMMFAVPWWACKRGGPPGADVWAMVDGKPIYRQDVERQVRNRASTDSDPGDAEQALGLKLNILNELINNQILVAHAEHAGISVSETEVDQKLKELETPYSKEDFERKLNAQGLTRDELRGQVRESLLVTKLINKDISSEVSVTDAEISEFYERNKARFNVPETTYHLAQIEVTPTATPEVRNLKNDDAKNPAAAERKIQALYAQLRAGGDFAKLAAEYSEDPRTSVGGGDLGFIPASSLDQNPALKQAVVSLKVGEISGIIRTPTGFHIVKLLARDERGQRTLDDPAVKNGIRQSLANEKEELLRTAYIENLRNQAKVENYLAEQVVEARGNPVK